MGQSRRVGEGVFGSKKQPTLIIHFDKAGYTTDTVYNLLSDLRPFWQYKYFANCTFDFVVFSI